jgi:hypothetical protein
MAQADSRWPITAEAWIWSQASQFEFRGAQSGSGKGFSPEYFGFPLSASFHRRYKFVHFIYSRRYMISAIDRSLNNKFKIQFILFSHTKAVPKGTNIYCSR